MLVGGWGGDSCCCFGWLFRGRCGRWLALPVGGVFGMAVLWIVGVGGVVGKALSWVGLSVGDDDVFGGWSLGGVDAGVVNVGWVGCPWWL